MRSAIDFELPGLREICLEYLAGGEIPIQLVMQPRHLRTASNIVGVRAQVHTNEHLVVLNRIKVNGKNSNIIC